MGKHVVAADELACTCRGAYRLVAANELDSARAAFSKITSEHVYSVHEPKPESADVLFSLQRAQDEQLYKQVLAPAAWPSHDTTHTRAILTPVTRPTRHGSITTLTLKMLSNLRSACDDDQLPPR